MLLCVGVGVVRNVLGELFVPTVRIGLIQMGLVLIKLKEEQAQMRHTVSARPKLMLHAQGGWLALDEHVWWWRCMRQSWAQYVKLSRRIKALQREHRRLANVLKQVRQAACGRFWTGRHSSQGWQTVGSGSYARASL